MAAKRIRISTYAPTTTASATRASPRPSLPPPPQRFARPPASFSATKALSATRGFPSAAAELPSATRPPGKMKPFPILNLSTTARRNLALTVLRHGYAPHPPAYCNTDDADLLSRVLPGFDQETRDFYRWQVAYTPEELADLIRSRLGVDLGPIREMQALARGPSGRIYRLKDHRRTRLHHHRQGTGNSPRLIAHASL